MDTLEPLLRQHEFFEGLAAENVALLVGCSANTRHSAGTYLAREGDPADRFFLIREGKVALEIATPGRGPVTIQTVGQGGIVGFSWLFEPFQWQFDALVVEPVRAIVLDGVCLRRTCEADPRLGFELMQRFARIAVARLQATRLQVMDVYGHAGTC